MTQSFTFIVNVEIERREGKFATRDEIAAACMEALSSADIGQFTGDNGGEYETTAWEVTEEPQKPRRRSAHVERTGPTSARVVIEEPAGRDAEIEAVHGPKDDHGS